MKKIKYIAILAVLAGFTGFYTVDSKEEAVVTRFGKYVKTVSSSGAKFKIPFIEKVQKVDVQKVNRLEFGFRTVKEGDSKNPAKYEEKLDEAKMITEDENLVLVETSVQYRVNDARKFFFNVDDPIGTLRIVSESMIRRTIGANTLDDVLANNKAGIQEEIRKSLQDVCNKYDLGVSIIAVQLQDVNPPKEVEAAFKDVTNAREDKNSKINEANSYKNEQIPKARGEASAMINAAQGYKIERINNAQGDVSNFLQLLDKYHQGKEVTKTRMYLEVMEQVLPNVDKYIVNEKGETVKFLPLNENTVISSKEEKK